jgi:hypothetical protein
MEYFRTFPTSEAAHEVAKLEGFENYEVVSEAMPITVPLPLGAEQSIPNVRYAIRYN